MDIKDTILNAAIELFSNKGFDGVSIREIANLAEVHFASIRYHFGDKEDLYRACISKHGESRLVSARRFLSTEPKSYEDMRLRLGYAVEDVFRIHNENPFLTKLLLHEVESTTPRSDIILRKTMFTMTETFSHFFNLCQQKNFIGDDVPPLFLTQSLMGVIHHFIRTAPIRERMLAQKPLKQKENIDAMTENIITLIVGKKHTKEIL
jgi:AcrR family transcriptional regulator